MKVQRIITEMGDGSLIHDVKVIDEEGGSALIPCDIEEGARRLVFALAAACFTTEEIEESYIRSEQGRSRE